MSSKGFSAGKSGWKECSDCRASRILVVFQVIDAVIVIFAAADGRRLTDRLAMSVLGNDL
jgi:hypothetical protein